jgi:O-antigen ligase
MSIVWLIAPVLWSKTLAVGPKARWVFTTLSVLWLLKSGGRTGLVALLLVPLLYAMLKPSPLNGRTSRVLFISIIGGLLYVGVTSVSIPGIPALGRISQEDSVVRQSDEIRDLLNEKSRALAAKHPVLGVGWGLYEGQYDPVIEKARTTHIRESALNLPGHNTYFEVVATTGYTGLLLYLGALAVPLIAGVRRSYDSDVRALTTGYAVVLFCITFHSTFGSLVSLPAALLLAAVARAGPRPTPAGAEASAAVAPANQVAYTAARRA